MRLLLIGSGGREHALAWRLTREDPSLELIAAPGNPGIAELGACVPADVTDVAALEHVARSHAVDLVVVGPEAPLAAGVVDHFRRVGIPIFGPTRAAAEIETSKAFAKQLMLEHGIPTARAEMHTHAADAKNAARRLGAPVVIKASGLAAGKGVVVCYTLEQANCTIDDMLEGDCFGDAGHEVLVEEFMSGEELSLFAVTNGTSFVTLPGLQDHKRLRDGDEGPNTGGMGAYLPVALDASVREIAERTIIAPTLAALAACGRPFTGLLYAGLMITRDGPKVVEFNCRFGDPETQALMPALSARTRLLDLLRAVAMDEPLPAAPVDVDRACVTTVLAAERYPEKPCTGDAITLPPSEPDVYVFHAGTKRDAQGTLVTAGGRVLAVSATAGSVRDAQHRSQAYAARVDFRGKQYRRDIGWREIQRASSEQPVASAGASGD